MKFSIFTPSHDLKRIERAAKSLAEQEEKDFEWVICLNGKAKDKKEWLSKLLNGYNINYNIFEDSSITNIGYLKKVCCEKSNGEILVELDHDDELVPECLKSIWSHHEKHQADFYYSDDIDINKDGVSFAPFSAQYGWQYYTCPRGRVASKAFEPTPISFGYIWYAPNHVRCWTKDFYEKVGGHNPEMDVLDDHELICRTYIEGNCVRIPEPLYVYHHTGENTCSGEKNKKIQQLTVELHDKYIEDMAAKWSDLNNLKKVDLCPHRYKKEGFIGVDISDYPQVDVVHDLNVAPWPFEDNSVGVFRLQDALEHLKDPVKTIKEIYRCLAPNGWALIEVPSTDGRGAFQDPTHVTFWNSNSFWYYTKQAQAQFIDTPVKFQLNRILNYYPTKWHETHLILYTKAHLVKLDGENIPAGGREI